MEYKKDIEMVIKRYEAFWNKDKLDRIPIRIRFPVGSLQAHESYYEPKAKINESERWEDIVLDPEKYLAYWDRQLKVRAPLMDDSIPTASVDLGPALMCGIMGADITFASGASWSNDPLENWDDIDNYSFNVENKWVRKLIELAKYFVEHSEGKFAVGLANIMGPTDILTCLRGATQTCIDLYEFPDEVIKLIEKCTQAYIETIKIQLDIIPRYYGGTCEGYSMWTPGRSNWLANDLSTMISPETYRNFMFKYDQEIVDYLDSCWMHVHSGGAYMIEEFLKLQNLKGVQIVSDKPSGPDLKDLLPIMKKIQNKHCLILRKFDLEEIKESLPELSPNKLFIDTQGSSFPEAEIMLQEWDLLTRRM